MGPVRRVIIEAGSMRIVSDPVCECRLIDEVVLGFDGRLAGDDGGGEAV